MQKKEGDMREVEIKRKKEDPFQLCESGKTWW